MGTKVYFMRVSNDEFEHPLSELMNSVRLAEICGTTPKYVRWCTSPAAVLRKKNRKNPVGRGLWFARVVIDLDDDDF